MKTKKVTVEITPKGWTTTVEINNKIMVEKHKKTSNGAEGIEGNFEDEKDIPNKLCDVLSDFFPFDVMKALNNDED